MLAVVAAAGYGYSIAISQPFYLFISQIRMSPMQEQYVPQSIEPAVQQHWDAKKTFKAVEKVDKEKFYCLHVPPTRLVDCTWGTCVTTP